MILEEVLLMLVVEGLEAGEGLCWVLAAQHQGCSFFWVFAYFSILLISAFGTSVSWLHMGKSQIEHLGYWVHCMC